MNKQEDAGVPREAERLAWAVQDGLWTAGALHRALAEYVRRQLLERPIADKAVRLAVSDLDALLEVAGICLCSITQKQDRLVELLLDQSD